MIKLIATAAMVTALLLPGAAAAEPLTFSGLNARTVHAEVSDRLQNCQASPTVRGQTVCAMTRPDLGGVPLDATLVSFQDGSLRTVSLIAIGAFDDVSRILARRYGRPSTERNTPYAEEDGSRAVVRLTEWRLDDGSVQAVAVEGPGRRQGVAVRLTWNPLNF